MNRKTLFTLLIIILIVSMTVLYRAHHQDLLLQGEVDATEVIVTSKAKGRVVKRLVERGDDVKAGQILLQLDSPEMTAQLHALQASRDQAQAQLTQSLRGTREESIRSLKAQLAQAEADYQKAQSTYARNAQVAAKGYISAQALEDARRTRDAAWQKVQQAKAGLDEAVHGDRPEQRAMYKAQLEAAEQQLLEFKAQIDDLAVKAPVDGEVGPIAAELGELLNAGSPLLTLVRQSQAWFVFNLREDILAHVKKGDRIMIRVPALNNKLVEAEVRYISPLGDYATKRATRATGDFDLKTFEVRLYPIKPVEGLRQGMSALWQWKK